MNHPSCIFCTRPGGAAGDNALAVLVPAGQAAGDAAQTVREQLEAAGCAGREVVLAVPSESCLCAHVASNDLPAKDRRRALLYRLEEKVPVCAEDLVADFVSTSDGALGVCAPRAGLAPLVEALELRGVSVAAVCPVSLLAMQRLLEREQTALPPNDGAADPYDAVVMGRDGAIEMVLLDRGLPRAWCVFSDDPKDLLLHVKLESFNGRPPPCRVLAVGLPAAVSSILSEGLGVPLTPSRPNADADAAAAMAERVLSRRSGPWVNLRGGLRAQDRLRPVRGPLRFAAAAVSLCLLSACAAMLWRTARYDQLAARYAGAQREVFRQVFPNQPEPPDVRSRLDSEERGLKGLSGDSSTAPPPPASGLPALRDLLGHLPQDVRFRLLELRLDGPRFALDGQVRSHGDADAIAAALRTNPGFSVDPPRTEQLAGPAGRAEPGDGAATTAAADKVVAFTLTGTVNAEAPPTRKAAP